MKNYICLCIKTQNKHKIICILKVNFITFYYNFSKI